MDNLLTFRVLCLLSFIAPSVIAIMLWFLWSRPETKRKHQQVIDLADETISELREKENLRQDEIMTHEHEWGNQLCLTLINRQIYLGMTTIQVILAWGKPQSIDQHEITNSEERIRWVYGERWNKPSYVYFINGKVSKIKRLA